MKENIYATDQKVRSEDQRLIFLGRELKDDQIAGELIQENGKVVHLIRRKKPDEDASNQPQNEQNANTNPFGNTNSFSNNFPINFQMPNPNFGNNPPTQVHGIGITTIIDDGSGNPVSSNSNINFPNGVDISQINQLLNSSLGNLGM